MKKINLFLVSIMLIMTYTLNSQTLVKEVSVNLFGSKEKGAKFSLKSLKCTDGNIQIGAFIQRKGRIDNKKMFKVLKGGYFPAVKVYTFDGDLNKKSIDIKNINLNSYTGNNSDYSLVTDKIYEIGNNNDDLSYEELQKKYPDILMPKDTKPENEKYFIDIERKVKIKIYESSFDILSNSITKKETGIKTVPLEYPETDILRKKFGYGLSNDKNDRFIFVSGLFYDKKARKADPSKKWNEFRQYEINSFDKNGKCLNTFNIDFDYPKVIKYNAPVITNGKFEGFVYVFGYMPGAKKYNNPETKNKYWAVYFDENGKHIFTKEFESEPGTVFYSVHKFNNQLYFFVQGNDNLYGIIQLSQSNYNQKNINISTLKENTINGDYSEGLDKSYTLKFNKISIFVNENGNFLIIPEKKNTKSVKKGDKVVNVSTYKSFAVLFDKDGQFIKQFILPVKNAKSKSFSKNYQLVAATPEKFVLISNEVISGYKEKPYSKFMTTDGNVVSKNEQKYLISPVLMSINIPNTKVSAANLSEDVFYKLAKDVLFCTDKNNDIVYFVGTNKDRNKLVVSKFEY